PSELECDAKHAAQVVDEIDAVLLVEVGDDLGVGTGAEVVTARFEITAQFGMVVDLAVEGDPDGVVLVGNRLVAALKVDDAQSAKTKAAGATDEAAVVVGTAMGDGLLHRAHPRRIGQPFRVEEEFAADATHGSEKGSGWLRRDVIQTRPSVQNVTQFMMSGHPGAGLATHFQALGGSFIT